MSDQNTTDGEQRGRFPSLRRDVLKAVGAGGALGVLGGSAVASQHQNGGDGSSGTATGSDGTTDQQENTVHVVETLIGPSTNPQRPADFFYQPTGLHVQPGDVVKFVFTTPDHTVTSYHPVFGMQRRIPTDADAFSSPLLGWDPDSLPDGISMPPSEEGPPAGNGGEPPADNGTETPGNATGTPNGDTNVTADNTTVSVENGTATPDGNATATPDDGAAEMPPESGDPEPSTWLHAFEIPGVYDMECAPHEGFGMAMRVVVGDETDTEFETSNPENMPPPRAGPVGLARVTLTDPALEPERIVEEGQVRWQDLEATQSDGGDGSNGEGGAGE